MKLIRKRISKSVISLILSVALVLAAAVFPASAAEEKGTISYNKQVYDTYSAACDALAQGILNLESKIDLSAYNVSVSEIGSIVEVVHTAYPELFFLGDSFGYGYSYNPRTDLITYFSPKYTLDANQIGMMRTELQPAVDSYLSDIDSSMSDFEKAVILHDKLALNCKYDLTTDNSGNIYGALVEGTAKCTGYAVTYSYLLSLVGIDSELIVSDSMNHMWNKICLDGIWYNVDVTFDDPLMNGYDDAGYVRHKFFLLSDAAISDMPDASDSHTDFDDAYYRCVSTKYDSSILHEINTKLCLIDGSFYMIDNTYNSKFEKSLLKYDTQSDSAAVVKSFSNSIWFTGTGSYYWTGGYMSLDEYGGKLYYNTVSTVNSYDVAANKETVLYDGGSSATYYGMVIDGRDVYVDVQASPNAASTLTFVGTLAEIVPPTTVPPTTVPPTTEPPTTVPPTTVPPTTVPPTTEPPTTEPPTTEPPTTEPPTTVPPTTEPPTTEPPTTVPPTTEPPTTEPPTTVPPTTVEPTTEPATTEPKDVIIGDVNLDGSVTIDDATTIQKYIAELVDLNPEALRCADVNSDGEISISDATSIQKYLAGVIDTLG